MSSLRQRRSGWDRNTSILSLIIVPFSKGINTILVIDIEGGLGGITFFHFFRVSLSRVIFLGFLDLIDI